MPLRNLSIEHKMTWITMLTVVAALLISMATLFAFESIEFRINHKREIGSIAEILGANVTAALEFDDAAAGTLTLSALARDSRIIGAGVYDSKGRLFSKYQATGDELYEVPRTLESIPGEHLNSYLEVSHRILLKGTQIGTIVVWTTPQQIYRRLLEYSIVLTLALGAAVIGAYFISRFLRKIITAPILSLAETARTISRSGDYSMRVQKSTNDEIGTLIEQFNGMIDQVSRTNSDLQISARLLEQNEHQLRLITDSLPVLIAYVDPNLCYRFNNAEYERWFGLSREELKGRSIKSVVSEDKFAVLEPYLERVLKGEITTVEGPLSFPVTGDRFISSTFIPDMDADGFVKGFFALTTDITARKEQENELIVLNDALEQRVHKRTLELEQSQERVRQAERLASIGTLAAGIAHEIRNPLNSIYLAVQYALRKHANIDRSVKEVFVTIGNEALRCSRIIKNVLQFAKSEQTEKSPHDLNDVVKHALDLARTIEKKQFSVELSLTEDPIFVVMNPTEVEQVVINLINNAVEASREKTEININTKREDGRVVLVVRDRGPGIPPEVMNHIFDPFFSTKRQQGNTGLGLSLSHGIISEHGGAMTVESTVGKGTTFRLEFPEKQR